MCRLCKRSSPLKAPPSSLRSDGLSLKSSSSRTRRLLNAPASIHEMLLEYSHRTYGYSAYKFYIFTHSIYLHKNTIDHIIHLCLKTKGVSSELSDAVVLQEYTLRVIGHSSRNSGEVLRLAADCHGRVVAYTQPGTCLTRCTATCQQPHHQPERQTTCGERRMEKRVENMLLRFAQDGHVIMYSKKLLKFWRHADTRKHFVNNMPWLTQKAAIWEDI